MIVAVHQPQYIPWLGYFDKIARCDCFVFLDQVQYKPREFQNRNKIRTKNGWIWLSVPVVSKGKSRQRISDCLIDNEYDWRRKHLNSLQAWYAKAKFFDKYIGFFKEIYSREHTRLIELNIQIIDYILKQLSISKKIYLESDLGIDKTKTDRIIEICKKLRADTYLSGRGGREYLEEEKFNLSRIKLSYQDFLHPVYHQQFAKDETEFIPNMSVLDLLFNEGEKAGKFYKGGGH